MTFADIPSGARVFVDANTLIYHFTAHPVFGPPCTVLLDRIDRGDVKGFTAAHLISEMSHRLMTIEASQYFGWPFAGIARRLRRHWRDIQSLPQFRAAVADVRNSRIQVFAVRGDLVEDATLISHQFGLLSNDALAVAVMQNVGITSLASNDADFDRVRWITRYAPT